MAATQLGAFGERGNEPVAARVSRPRLAMLAVALLLALPGPGAAAAAQGRPGQAGPAAHRTALTLPQALVLGLVEGITEYLPISSTGHLVLAERAMGVGERPEEREAADAYAICIQLGAIVAVLALYRRRVAQVLRGLLGQDEAGRRLAANLVVAFLPAGAVGFLLEGAVKRHLFGLWPIVAAWLVGGVAILLIARCRRAQPPAAGLDLPELTWRGALLVGVGQCLALWPGTSRSLATILGGLLVGLSLPAAVEFSFLLGVLTLGAATGWDLLRHGSAIVATFGWLNPLAGFAVAALSAAVAVRWLVAWLERHGLALFGWYRIALSLAVTLWLLRR